ncbi:MAG: hypothetical protein DI536_19420 [Archangium gephyra]|uniref:DUF4340 domain-containing protein n=1 Tax=Archangium gephyra TaxID=48 RepID=A0A2W5TCF6_9BACT|nr:MAG: hypothetical protein DI536_19420 [Archangium gephyra]
MTQSSKLLLQVLVLVLIAGGLGGYAYFGVFKPDEARQRKADHDLRLFAPQKLDEKVDGGAPPAEFTHLVVTFNGETTELEREPGQPWYIVKPVRTRADHLIVDGLISQLQSAKFKDTIDEAPDSAALAKYGLDQPKFVVEATANVAGEERSVKIFGGIENTFDGSVFVRRNDEKAVYSAPGGVRFALGKNTFDLRDKTPFAIEESKLERLSVSSVNKNEYELVREGKRWKLTRPADELADATNVATMIAAASSDRAVRFFDDTPANRKALGLDAPILKATLTLAGGKSAKLSASRVVADGGDLFYGLREDDEGTTLAQMSASALTLDRNVEELRDQAVLQFKRELVTRMVFHDSDGSEVVVEKDSVDASADSWRITKPRPAKAKVFKITGALWTLSNFKALAKGEQKPGDWAKYGIGEKSRWAAVYGEDGKELARLTIGNLVEGTPSAYWVRGARDQVMQSDGSRFGELPFQLAVVADEPDAGVTSP